MTILAYPRLPIVPVWQDALPGQTIPDGITIKGWLSDYAPAGDTVATASIAVSPAGLTFSAVTISGYELTATHEGGLAGTTYLVVFNVTTTSGLIGLFPVLFTIRAPFGTDAAPSSIAALSVLMASLPTTLPADPGVIWRNGGALAVS